GSGTVDIADPIFNLQYQFVSGVASCLDALDTNDDGVINVADPVYGLSFLFADGPPAPPPFPGSGLDPTPDTLGCEF
ncbi:MAG: hypothetical protein V3T77_02755, partial [Planctomycetota bacterium]